MIIPYRVTTLTMRSPWANLVLLALNIVMFALTAAQVLSDDQISHLILADWSPPAFIGYQFLHAGFFHLAGNMILLWVFGNALNGIMHDLDFTLTYLAAGIVAGGLHLVVDGAPVVGASGAISGLMGLYLAVYPHNEVSCFYWILRPGTFDVKGYYLIVGWFLWDVISALRGVPGVACWAHVGGTLAGFGTGVLLLKMGRIHIADYDNPTVLDVFSRRRE